MKKMNSFSNQTESRSLPSSRYSSSYTSWTKPFVGHMVSDSFAPQSDIFDDVDNSYAVELEAFDEYKKLRRRSSADTYKDISDIEDFEFDSIKTKNFVSVVKALNLEDKKSLFVFGAPNNSVYLSSRNLKGSDVVICSELSTYKILNANQLVLLESSLNEIKTNLSK